VSLVVSLPPFVVVRANSAKVAHADDRVPFLGILHNRASNLVKAVVHRPRFSITDTRHDLLALPGFAFPMDFRSCL
jgi:hypothetical protein